MATIHICDKCGERPPSAWYGLNVYELNEDGRAVLRTCTLDLCFECYKELVSEFDCMKRNTPAVEVKVAS